MGEIEELSFVYKNVTLKTELCFEILVLTGHESVSSTEASTIIKTWVFISYTSPFAGLFHIDSLKNLYIQIL